MRLTKPSSRWRTKCGKLSVILPTLLQSLATAPCCFSSCAGCSPVGSRSNERRATLVGLGSTSLDIFGPRSEVLHNVDATRLAQSTCSEDTTYPIISLSLRCLSACLGSTCLVWEILHGIFMGFHGLVCMLQASEAYIGMTC